MTQFQLDIWQTDDGPIASYSSRSTASDDRPVVVLLHGALRSSEVLFPWANLISDLCDTVLIDLPGHGRSPSSGPLSIERMAAMVQEVIGMALPSRRVVIVGESLGGTVALAIGGAVSGNVAAVFAADPLMTTAKLWQVGNVFGSRIGKSDGPDLADRLARETFGITPTGIEEMIYYPLVGALRVPAVIATGDVPLFPPRQVSRVPCVFDAVDRFVIEMLYPGKAKVRQIPDCGHVVLTDAPMACRDMLMELLRESSEPRDPAANSL